MTRASIKTAAIKSPPSNPDFEAERIRAEADRITDCETHSRVAYQLRCGVEPVDFFMALLQWIEDARCFIDTVQSGCKHLPALDAQVRSINARFPGEWSSEESTGQQMLLSHVHNIVGEQVEKACIALDPQQKP